MKKTYIDKRIINVIDCFGNKLEPTYFKRAKGLVKCKRAIFINEKTILINDVLKIKNNLEENEMNNNENKKNIEEIMITQEYIIKKIDEIMAMNQEALLRKDLADFSNVPGTKNPIQAICETNNKMINFLKEIMYKSFQQKSTNEIILEGYIKALLDSIGDVNCNDETRQQIIQAITGFQLQAKH